MLVCLMLHKAGNERLEAEVKVRADSKIVSVTTFLRLYPKCMYMLHI